MKSVIDMEREVVAALYERGIGFGFECVYTRGEELCMAWVREKHETRYGTKFSISLGRPNEQAGFLITDRHGGENSEIVFNTILKWLDENWKRVELDRRNRWRDPLLADVVYIRELEGSSS